MTTVLVSGGCGFIGHHTVEHILKNTDWHIVVVDGLNYAGNLRRLADIDVWFQERDRVRFVHHDIRSPFSIAKLHEIGDADYIVHMAAETHVDRSISDPEPFVMTNVIGTYNMLQLARQLQPSVYFQVSTDEVYGPARYSKGELQLHSESEPHRPSNPYSASKA